MRQRQLSLFTTAQVAVMRDRTASRNYSPQRDEFRRRHEEHRARGLARRHAARLNRIRGATRPAAHREAERHAPSAGQRIGGEARPLRADAVPRRDELPARGASGSGAPAPCAASGGDSGGPSMGFPSVSDALAPCVASRGDSSGPSMGSPSASYGQAPCAASTREPAEDQAARHPGRPSSTVTVAGDRRPATGGRIGRSGRA